MKPEIKDRNSSIMIEELKETIIAIESLEEYYINSIENVQSMKLRIEREYEIGLLVNSKLTRCATLN